MTSELTFTMYYTIVKVRDIGNQHFNFMWNNAMPIQTLNRGHNLVTIEPNI